MYSLNPNSMSSPPATYGAPQQPQPAMGQQPSSPYPSMTMPNAYAHGGRIKRGRMVTAHFNPRELDVLDHLQGKKEEDPRSGMRSYSHLEELLKNPHIRAGVHHHTHRHRAMGGGMDPHALASHGVHGDSEIAMIGPHTHQILSSLAEPGTIRNHQDGRPQYWSLGSTLGGLWNTIKGAAGSVADAASPYMDTLKGAARTAAPYVGAFGKAVLPGVQHALAGAATGQFGPLGGMAVEGLGSLANQGLDKLSQMGPEGHQAMANTLGEGAQSALRARQGGAGALQSFGQGLNQVGSRFSGPAGGALQGLGSQLREGNTSLAGLGKAMGRGAYEGAGGAEGLRQGLGNAAASALSHYQAGSSPQAMGMEALQGAGRGLRNSVPTLDRMQNQDAFNELPFAGGY